MSQDPETAPCSTAEYPGSKLVSLGESRQSFVPSRGGLASVDVCIQDLVGITGTDVTVHVYEGGTATDPGPEIASVPVDVGGSLLAAQWVHVDFPDEVPTTAGAGYVLGLDPAQGVLSSVSFQWRATCSDSLLTGCEGTPDTYPEGSTNDLPANADYAFRTFPLHEADLVGAVDVDPVVCPGLDMAGRASGTVTNTGATSVAPFATEWRLSSDPTLSADDLSVNGSRHDVPTLGAGESATVPPPTSLPDASQLTAGPWYLLLQVDVDGVVVESSEANNVAAGMTTVSACGQPEITDLALTVDEDQVATGFRRIQAADLPLRALADGLPQSAGEEQANIDSAPVGFSPVGFSPVGFSPVGFSPVGFSPVGFSPVGFSPVGFSPVGFSPVGFSPLAEVLDDLPVGVTDEMLAVDVPIVGAGWEARLAGSIGDRPIQDITLREAADLLPDLKVQDVDLRGILHASWLSLALANGTLDDVPLGDGSTPCQWLAGHQDFDCAVVGIDPASDSLLALESAGAPVRSLPIGDQPLSATTMNPAWLVNAMPLTGSPRAHLEFTRLGGMAAEVGLTDPNAVVDCGSFDCSRPLSEAVDAGALRPVTVGDLLADLSTAGRETATVTDLALLVIDLGSVDLGDMLWTLADPYRVDASCPEMTYHLTGDNTGTADAVAPEAVVTLAPGFGYVPGSATLTHDGGDPAVQSEPLVTRDSGGARTLTFALQATVASTFDLSFRACANLYLGHQEVGTGSVSGFGIEHPYSSQTDPVAPDLVEVVEQTEETGPTDTPDTAQEVAANDVIALHLQSADDVDFLKVPVPDEPDSLTIVRVFPPPTVDADLVVHGPAESPFGFSPVGFSPVGFSPVGFSPVGFSPVGFSPVGFSNEGAPVNGSDDTAEPDPLNDVPTQLAPSDASGLRAISAHRGDQVETAYLRNYDGDQGYFTVGVSGYNGIQSDAPVIVTFQQIAPTPNPDLAVCAPAPWDLTAAPSTTAPSWSGPEPPRTVFVTNRQVSTSLYGAAETDAGIAALDELAGRPEVRGIVLEVDHSPDVRQAYSDWRADWCSPTAANVAASQIRAEILRLRAQYPSIDTVVLAGGDEVVPSFRVIDHSVLANEAQYTDSLVKAVGGNNALVAAYAHGDILTVDPFGTTSPIVYGESFAYVPSAGVSRLVETPADWIAQKDQYVASDGAINPSTGFVSGYQGMVDGATAAADALGRANVPATRLTSDDWTADEFRSDALDAGAAGWNGHANHWALLSAAGSLDSSNAQNEIITPQSDLPPFGGLVFSNGCHFGAQAPDSLNPSPTSEQARRMADWSQAIAGRGGIAVANSGFGIFETEIVGYGEQLQALFVDALRTSDNASLALARAKAVYFGSLGVYDPYAYKTVQQLSMFGLGIFKLFGTSAAGPAPTPAPDTDAIDVSTGPLEFATLTTDRGTIVDVVNHPSAIDTTPLAVNSRPIVPKLTIEVPLPAGKASAGVWITNLESSQVGGVDPVISRAGISRPDRDSESQTRSTIFPTTPAVALDRGGVSDITFPVGSFRSSQASNGRAQGSLRLDSRVDGQLLLRDRGDTGFAPTITEVTAVRSQDGSLVGVDVRADETSGPNVRAAALARDDAGQWTYRELYQGADGHWTGSFALSGGATTVKELLVEVSNGHAVGYWRNKGEAPRLTTFQGDLDVTLSSMEGQADNGVFLGAVDATILGASDVVYRIWDGDHLLGDFTIDPSTGTIDVTVDGDGSHELRIEGSDGTGAFVPFLIDGSAPTVVILSPPVGGVYDVGTAVPLDFACPDTGTGANCAATVDGSPIADGALVPTDLIGDHTIVVTAVDGVGRTATLSRSYTVESVYVVSDFYSPIESKPTLNLVSSSSTIAVKFSVTDDAGTAYTDPAIVADRSWVPINCRTKERTGSAFTASGTAPEYSGYFHFNVDAPADKGCHELVVTLDDGTALTAYFKVK